MIRHIRKWNRWRKGCRNSWFHKILVFLKLTHSPSFELYFWIGNTKGEENG